MRLGETEALRKKQTKERFIYQNEVNSLQVEIRERLRRHKREMSVEARDRIARDEQ